MLSRTGAWAILMNVWPWVVFPASYFELVSALWISWALLLCLSCCIQRRIALLELPCSLGHLSQEVTCHLEKSPSTGNLLSNSKWELGKRFIWNCHRNCQQTSVDYLNKRETGILEQNQPLEEMWIFSLFPPCLTTWGFLLLRLPIYPFLSANHNLYPTYRNSKFWKS